MQCSPRFCRLVLCLSLVTVLSTIARAQTESLSGIVRDTSDHVVPSATVSARSVTTGKTYSTKTNASGVYTIPDLAAGDYKVWAVAGQLKARPVKITPAAGQTTDLIVSPTLRH